MVQPLFNLLYLAADRPIYVSLLETVVICRLFLSLEFGACRCQLRPVPLSAGGGTENGFVSRGIEVLEIGSDLQRLSISRKEARTCFSRTFSTPDAIRAVRVGNGIVLRAA